MSERRVPRWAVAAGLVLALIGITHLLLQQRAQRRALRQASLVSVSAASSRETAPSVAVLDGGNVGVAWVESDGRVGARLLAPAAHAAGEIVRRTVPTGAGTEPHIQSAQLLADGRGGAWLVSLVSAAGGFDLDVARADSGGLEFRAVNVPRTPGAMMIDRAMRAGTVGGALLVPLREQRADGGVQIVLADATRGDTAPVVVAEGRAASSPAVCASDGRVVVAYVEEGARVVVRAADATHAFTAPPTAVSREGEVTAGWAPTCFARGDAVTVTYGVRSTEADRLGGLAAIVVARSVDGGRTFPARSEAREPGMVLASPASAEDASGDAILVYYAARDAEGAAGALRWARVSPGRPVSAREVRAPIFLSFLPHDVRAIGENPGTGTAVAAAEGHVAVAFVDNADGAPHVAFAELGP